MLTLHKRFLEVYNEVLFQWDELKLETELQVTSDGVGSWPYFHRHLVHGGMAESWVVAGLRFCWIFSLFGWLFGCWK